MQIMQPREDDTRLNAPDGELKHTGNVTAHPRRGVIHG